MRYKLILYALLAQCISLSAQNGLFIGSGASVYIPTGASVSLQDGELVNTGELTNSGSVLRLGIPTNAFTNSGVTKGDNGVFGGGLFSNLANGRVEPGSSIGCLNFNNGYTTSGITDLALAGTTACSSHDQIIVQGTAQLSGLLNITLENGFVPSVGQSFVLLTATSVNGTFAAVNTPSVPGITWGINYNPTEVVLTAVQTTVYTPGADQPCNFRYFWPLSGAVVGSSNASTSCYIVRGNNSSASSNFEPTDCGSPGDRGVWYFFRMPGCSTAGGVSELSVKISTNNIGTTLAGTNVAVYSVTNSNSCVGAGFQRIACSNSSTVPGCSGASASADHGTLEFGSSAPDGRLMANGNYFIYVSGDNGAQGDFELSFEYVQRGAITVTAGPSPSQATINVPDNGHASFKPQWRPVGATGWASINGMESSLTSVLPPNSLMPGVAYEFRALYACPATYNYVMASPSVNFATTPAVSTCSPVSGLACNAVAGNVTMTWNAAPAGTSANLVVIARSGSTQLRGTVVPNTATSVSFNCPGCTATNTSFTLQSNCGGANYIASSACAVSAAGQAPAVQTVSFEHNGIVYEGVDFNDPQWGLFGVTPVGEFTMEVVNGQLVIHSADAIDAAGFDFELRPSVAMDFTNVVISTEQTVDAQLSISDMNGSILETRILKEVQNGTVVTLETSELAAGLYIISVRTEAGNVAKKLVKIN